MSIACALPHNRALSRSRSDSAATVMDGDQLTRSFEAMGCRMSLTVVTADRARAELVLDMARQLIEDVEARLSRFRPESELSQLNACTGVWQTFSPVLGTVLGIALAAARRTGGLCSPTLLGALEAAGYDRDFDAVTARVESDQVAPVPDPVAAERAPYHVGAAWRAIRVSDFGTRVWLPAGVRLDLAGVAKGWTADRVADLLAQVGPCLVDAGGDISVRGVAPGLAAWPIAIANPFAPDADLALVMVRDGGVATSGVDHRRWTHHGRPQHHLIDPRTGRPAQTDAVTASVIAHTTTAADVHAKTALLLGVSGGLTYLRHHRLAGLIVRQDGRSFVTPRWSDYAFPT